MKRFVLHSVLLAIATVSFSLNYSVRAQGLLDQGKNLVGGGSKSGAASLVGALPLDKIMELLKQQGYSNITGLAPSPSGNELQAKATNSSGSPVDLLVNPSTGKVLSAVTK
jgi:hypothetical protein